MKKFFIGLAAAFLLLIAFPKPVYAAPDCSTKGIGASGVPDDFVSGQESSFTISLTNLQENTPYRIHLDGPTGGDYKETRDSDGSGSLSLTFTSSDHTYGFQRMPAEIGQGRRKLYIDQDGPFAYCYIGDYHIRRVATLPDSCDFSVTPACIDRDTPGALASSNVILNQTAFTGTGYLIIKKGALPIRETTVDVANGSFSYSLGTLDPGAYTINLKNFMSGALICSNTLSVKEACQAGNLSLGGTPITVRPQECVTDIISKPGGYESDPIMAPGIKTALGCVPYDPGPLVTWVFGLAIFMGGGIAFLIMGVGAFLFITSQGNPEQIQKGKEIIVSAGTGLLFIIFSIFLLRLIGVDILKIPGFT